MVSPLAQNAKDVGLIPTLGTLFPIFITSMALVAITMILYKLQTEFVVEATLYLEIQDHFYMYVFVTCSGLH